MDYDKDLFGINMKDVEGLNNLLQSTSTLLQLRYYVVLHRLLLIDAAFIGALTYCVIQFNGKFDE